MSTKQPKIIRHKNGAIVDVRDPERPVILTRVIYADPTMEEVIFQAVKAEMDRRRWEEVNKKEESKLALMIAKNLLS